MDDKPAARWAAMQAPDQLACRHGEAESGKQAGENLRVDRAFARIAGGSPEEACRGGDEDRRHRNLGIGAGQRPAHLHGVSFQVASRSTVARSRKALYASAGM